MTLLKGDMSLEVSAPGKAIIAGEYAVLEGSPCLVMAVNRRLILKSDSYQPRRVVISALGLDTPAGELILDEQGQLVPCTSRHWPEALDTLRKMLNESLTPSALTHLTQFGWQLQIDSSQLFEQGNKLGLGSSAALCAVVHGLMSARSDAADAENLLTWSRVQQNHCLSQGKVGSGVDIAASLSGGVSRFTRHPLSPGETAYKGQRADIQPFELPDGLQLQFLWMGQSASTPKMLHALSDWRRSNPDAPKALFQQMDSLLHQASKETGAGAFLEAVESFTERLEALATASGLAIFDGGHSELRALAKASRQRLGHNAVVKPCGAGGGDLGLILAPSNEDMTTFIAELQGYKVQMIELSIDKCGLALKPQKNSI